MSDIEETDAPPPTKSLPPPPAPPPPKRTRTLDNQATVEEPPVKLPCMDKSLSANISTDAGNESTASRQGISNVVSQEEFEIIDDLGSDGEENGNGDMDDKDDLMDDDGDDSYIDSEDDDFLLSSEEIDKLLDEGIDHSEGGPHDNQSELTAEERALIPPTEKEKIVLVERGHDPFDILPEGWVVVTHNSGMPVYLHKKSRVCTLSRPYFLGPGSARKHDIPTSAIPCLQYRKAVENESKQKTLEQNGTVSAETCPVKVEPEIKKENEDTETSRVDVDTENQDGAEDSSKASLPSVRVETAEEYKKVNSLDADQVREYCQKVFEFQAIKVRRFKTWKDRRKHNNLIKKANLWKKSNRPSLPANTKLITCPIPASEEGKGKGKKEFVLNPAGKSDVCILHEYVQHALRVQPRFIFEELDNAQTPFSATVMINDTKYATGFATSKKAAKLEAASKTLAILIPDINKAREEEKQAAGGAKSTENKDLLFFDQIKIEDPRVTELSVKAGQPYPFQILYECLKRNYGIGDTDIHMEMKTLKHQKSEFLMKVGKHEAKVVCKNKREGKQQAAQAILQLMHPHIHTWGSLLRLYSKDNTPKEDGAEEEGYTVQATAGLKKDPVSGETAVHQEASVRVLPSTEDACHEYYGMMVRDMDSQTGEELSSWEVEALEVDEKMWKEKQKMLQESMITGKFYLYKVHRAVQTEWEGHLNFHKAVQYPEVLYTKEDVENWGTRPDSQPSVNPQLTEAEEVASDNQQPNGTETATAEGDGAEDKEEEGRPDKQDVSEIVQAPIVDASSMSAALASRVAAQQEAINRSPSRAQLAAFASSQAAAAAYQRSVMHTPTSVYQIPQRVPTIQAAAGAPYMAAAAAAAVRPQAHYILPQLAAQQQQQQQQLQLQQLQQQQYHPLAAHGLQAAPTQAAQYVQLMPQGVYPQAPVMMPMARPQAGIYPMGAYQPRFG